MSPRHSAPATEPDDGEIDDRPTLEMLIPDLDTLLDAFTVADEAGYVDVDEPPIEEGGAASPATTSHTTPSASRA